MKIARVNVARCKACWSSDFPCPLSPEVGYELFRSQQTVFLGPASKMALPPCVAACPANICVQGYIGLIAAGLYGEAYRLIRFSVPFPQTLGLVCPHPCQEACIRGDWDEPLVINGLKRFAAEQVTPKMRRECFEELKSAMVENGLRVAVVGAGPAGLTAAHDLRLRGYSVTVFEALEKPGGMLLTGVPEYRLPRSVLQQEIGEILELGIRLESRLNVGEDVPLAELLSKYGAVFVASGASGGARLGIPGEEAEGVIDALKFLRKVNLGGKPKIGRRVAVIGGGDAAIDGARCALRLGAEEVLILYRRSRQEMPAHLEQVTQAEDEGIKLQERVAPVRFDALNDRLQSVELTQVELGEPDESGRRRPIPRPGSNFTVEADMAIVAVGQWAERQVLQGIDLELDRRGWVRADEGTMQTSLKGLFVGGDLTSGPATVVAAVAAGKRAAQGIDRYLRGEKARQVSFFTLADLEGERRYRPSCVPRQPGAEMPQASPTERIKDFRQVELGLDEAQARAEAERCLACGLCASCNACLDTFACPAILLDERGKNAIDEALCDGCGICIQLCPNDAIEQVEIPERERVSG
jgi:NADPH-dependent glutamate synthase beta subunit-like oxidoreductase